MSKSSFVHVLTSAIVACLVLCMPDAHGAAECRRWEAAVKRWESDMRDSGHRWGQYIDAGSRANQDQRFGAIYYDAQWVFYQIGDYLDEAEPWTSYAESAEVVYRNYFTADPDWLIAGWQRFPHGLYEDFRRGRGTTADELDRFRRMPAFGALWELSGEYSGDAEAMSREVAYLLQAHVFAERAGATRLVEDEVVVVNQLVQWARLHLQQWRSGMPLPGKESEYRFAPFMAALTLHALIDFAEWEAENGRDIDEIWEGDWDAEVADFLLWMANDAAVAEGPYEGQSMWRPQGRHAGTFYYEDRMDIYEAWDLNMLIAFPYAWFGQSVGAGGDVEQGAQLLSMADKLFVGGALNPYHDAGKQFNQAYRLSFRYLDARAAASEFYPDCR